MKKALLAILFYSICTGLHAQTWNGSYTMTIESYKAKEPVTAYMNFKDNKMAMEIITEKDAGIVRSIFDYKDNTMTTLSEKEGASKYAMVMKIKPEILETNEEEMKITQTDEQRSINGYNCRKTIVETKDGITEMWLTKDLNVSYENTLGMMPRTRNNPTSGYLKNLKKWKGIEGFPIEMISYTVRKPNEKSTIRFSDIQEGKVNEKAFDVSGYQVIDMTNLLPGK